VEFYLKSKIANKTGSDVDTNNPTNSTNPINPINPTNLAQGSGQKAKDVLSLSAYDNK